MFEWTLSLSTYSNCVFPLLFEFRLCYFSPFISRVDQHLCCWKVTCATILSPSLFSKNLLCCNSAVPDFLAEFDSAANFDHILVPGTPQSACFCWLVKELHANCHHREEWCAGGIHPKTLAQALCRMKQCFDCCPEDDAVCSICTDKMFHSTKQNTASTETRSKSKPPVHALASMMESLMMESLKAVWHAMLELHSLDECEWWVVFFLHGDTRVTENAQMSCCWQWLHCHALVPSHSCGTHTCHMIMAHDKIMTILVTWWGVWQNATDFWTIFCFMLLWAERRKHGMTRRSDHF